MVTRWISRMRSLRWLDALVAWAALWCVMMIMIGPGLTSEAGVIAVVLLLAAIAVQPLRVRWRPITAWVGVAMSRDLRAGDRAWYIRAREADLVLVTARHGLRLVIARPELSGEETMTVRRTRVLLLPADRVE
jgi:hypothetical protein